MTTVYLIWLHHDDYGSELVGVCDTPDNGKRLCQDYEKAVFESERPLVWSEDEKKPEMFKTSGISGANYIVYPATLNEFFR